MSDPASPADPRPGTADMAGPADFVESPSAPSPWFGVALLLAASVFWSLSGVAVKLVAIDPLPFSMLRSLGAGLACGLVLPLGGRRWPRARWMVPTVLVHTLMVWALIVAMTWSTAAEGILLQYTGPLWCALYGLVFFGRRIGRKLRVALLLAAAGVGCMLLGSGAAGNLGGSAVGVLSGAAYGGVIILLDAIDRDRPGVNVFAIVCLNNLGSAALLLPLAIGAGLAEVPWRVGLFVLGVGVVQLGVPYVLFQLGVRRVGPLAASLLVLAEPVLNPLFAWVGAGERPPAAAFVGGGFILLAVVQAALAGRVSRRRQSAR